MKYILALSLFISCTNPVQNPTKSDLVKSLNSLMNKWHKDAAEANLDGYIRFMDSTCRYIGTDATENWERDEFASFCKPYFDKKTTWDFKTVHRTIQLNAENNTAWFDEILATHMGTCRGSGALENSNGEWKLMQYVLSVAIPNESMNAVKDAKHHADSVYISRR